MRLGTKPAQKQKLSIYPKLMALGRILQLSSAELRAKIDKELEENPALELAEEHACPLCGGNTESGLCLVCGYRTRLSPDLEIWQPAQPAQASPEDDPISRLQAPVTLREHLCHCFRLLSPSDKSLRIGRYLIDSVNDDGYLQCSLQEAAAELRVPPNQVERVLGLIQTLDPIGVGARDLRESLLIQVRYLESQGIADPWAQTIITDHWEQLGKLQFDEIARQLRITPQQVSQAARFIRDQLDPYPGRQFRVPWKQSADEIARITPDVIINEQDGAYRVEVVESATFFLKVNDAFRQAYRARRESQEPNPLQAQWIEYCIERARGFIRAISQRRKMLSEITECIVGYQHRFLKQGISRLRPLTRLRVAKLMGLHESTISRATANKYALLPNQEIIKFEDFFDNSLPAKQAIRDMICEEDFRTPLTDRQLTQHLGELGISLSRRTVAQYRTQLKIPPASQRRRSLSAFSRQRDKFPSQVEERSD